ncbi:MAG TPA: hypothetical protein VFG71_03245 [Nitrospiraceae bacterium]|nr:hypothetical protein [Nitrospiraceae bacterium]
MSWAKFGNIFMGCFFAIGALNIIWLAIYGYYIPANVRVGLSVPQVTHHLALPRVHDDAQSVHAARRETGRTGGMGKNGRTQSNTPWSCWRQNSLG